MTLHDDAYALRLSRRDTLATAARLLALATAAWAGTKADAARAQSKMSPQAAKYQDHPNGSKACAACSHFQPPDACHLVSGKISPNGWCQYFALKAPTPNQ